MDLFSNCRVTGHRSSFHSTRKAMSEIAEMFQRISQRPNVTGIIVVDSEGTPIRSTIEDTTVQNQYAHLITSLAAKARHCVRDLDPTNDLCFLRIRSKKNEIMVAPDKDFILIVIQNIVE
ncbi:dynein-associated roadblock protein-like protein [Leishmania major strain Friedlin]|uniref:Dynein-associated roadblock protein-like protein n=1 Tax=Leishmania major TaxID=5664 RepID=E9AEZ6_LEIMA|nr:dynein-associated roadblock protein-like protein [Leishmania major strain Friedlin]CBZ12800.1 dynein-associated roadblock protein-like protein [Leishmania major strain Friedlin]|eukprot:XP_003722566.1 dynein-associated roadblock protein-like protein [Leishmania major strain Friedlin]